MGKPTAWNILQAMPEEQRGGEAPQCGHIWQDGVKCALTGYWGWPSTHKCRSLPARDTDNKHVHRCYCGASDFEILNLQGFIEEDRPN